MNMSFQRGVELTPIPYYLICISNCEIGLQDAIFIRNRWDRCQEKKSQMDFKESLKSQADWFALSVYVWYVCLTCLPKILKHSLWSLNHGKEIMLFSLTAQTALINHFTASICSRAPLLLLTLRVSEPWGCLKRRPQSSCSKSSDSLPSSLLYF